MKRFLRYVCPAVSVVILIGGTWIWLGGTYLEPGENDRSQIVTADNPEHLLMDLFGMYFFLKCVFCAVVIFILSRWFLLVIEDRDNAS